MDTTPREFLIGLFHQAVAAAHPSRAVSRNLPPKPRGRTVVVGAGKAAAAMAKAVEDNWWGPISGLVVTRYEHGVECRSIEVVEAGHPVPDAAGLEAAQRMLGLLAGLTEDDLVLCLMSGGGSSLLTVPAPGVSLEDKQAVTRALLEDLAWRVQQGGRPVAQLAMLKNFATQTMQFCADQAVQIHILKEVNAKKW